MDSKEKEFQKRLRATFRIEADEHIQAISLGLIELEKTPDSAKRAEVIETIFREAHSLKGAARSVSLKDIESICQPLEGAFAALKRGEINLSPALFDLFHQAVNNLTQLVSSTDAEQTIPNRPHIGELVKKLASVSHEAIPPQAGPLRSEEHKPAEDAFPIEVAPIQEDVQVASRPTGEKNPILTETVRMSMKKLDPLLLQAEEMIMAKMAAGQRVAELQEIGNALVSWKTESAKLKERQSTEGARQWSESSEWNEARLNALQSHVATVTHAFEQDHRALRKMVDDHLDAVKQVLMLPVASLVEAFPKLVRDLAHDQAKDVELVIRGAHIEIDKRILEELKDPLIHLMRNCVDHGIKKPEERVSRNKPPRGTITLSFAAKNGRQVEVLVSDDGVGIDVNQVKAAAIKVGIISGEAAEKLDPQEALSLIFQSGVSTSRIITDISGRGLGLAIVREKVEKLGGAVSVDSQVKNGNPTFSEGGVPISLKTDAGTTFRLLVPLTLATFRGVLVKVDEHVFVLPTMNVERAVRVSKDDIKTVENRETIQLDGQILSMVRLGDTLGLPHRINGSSAVKGADNTATTNYIPMLVVTSGKKRIAFQVDEVLDELQVLVKGLGKQLVRVRNIAGATVLGTGRVAPVLNVPDLMKSAVRSVAVVRAAAVVEKEPSRTGRILVAEDSITARILIKNILETAGYQVATAVDGTDAFTQLRSGEFDLVVSDVDMPRMSGFELVTKIRDDKRLGELPVVLVTALESREDRERGIEVGANAYIIKSSFDQSNLLEAIRRLF